MQFSGPFAVEMWAHLDKTGDPFQAAKEAQKLVRNLLQSTAESITVKKFGSSRL
jgi:L-ribulose-5-phosphate 3-epimerase UlaE